jgi:hypothetical protein
MPTSTTRPGGPNRSALSIRSTSARRTRRASQRHNAGALCGPGKGVETRSPRAAAVCQQLSAAACSSTPDTGAGPGWSVVP